MRAVLGIAFKEFRKTPSAPNSTDAYAELGLHLYYDAADRLEFIEAFKPSEPRFQSVKLLGPREAVVQRLLEAGVQSTRQDSDGYFFDERICPLQPWR
jgi:hypothetical protein